MGSELWLGTNGAFLIARGFGVVVEDFRVGVRGFNGMVKWWGNKHAGNANLFDKVGVVADHNYCARVVAEILTDDFLGFGVEMISWFIEENKVSALHEDFAESNAGFFAWRKYVDFFVNTIALKKKVGEYAAEFGVGKIVGGDIFEDSATGVE